MGAPVVVEVTATMTGTKQRSEPLGSGSRVVFKLQQLNKPTGTASGSKLRVSCWHWQLPISSEALRAYHCQWQPRPRHRRRHGDSGPGQCGQWRVTVTVAVTVTRNRLETQTVTSCYVQVQNLKVRISPKFTFTGNFC
jgi:hypothetical protein